MYLLPKPHVLNITKYVCGTSLIIRILAGDHWEDVFLLSGDDLKVHLYRETQEAEVHNSSTSFLTYI